jgi:hypothetical protein
MLDDENRHDQDRGKYERSNDCVPGTDGDRGLPLLSLGLGFAAAFPSFILASVVVCYVNASAFLRMVRVHDPASSIESNASTATRQPGLVYVP